MQDVKMMFSKNNENAAKKRLLSKKDQSERKEIRRLRLELEEMGGYCHTLQCENIRLREFIQSLFEEVYPDMEPEDLSLLKVYKKV